LMRRSSCFCTNKCFTKFDPKELAAFLSNYWNMPRQDREALLASCSSNPSGTGTTSWSLLGQPVGANCFARIMGHSTRLLVRLSHGIGRLPSVKARSTRQASTVHSFLLTQWMSVAETLPDQSGPCARFEYFWTFKPLFASKNLPLGGSLASVQGRVSRHLLRNIVLDLLLSRSQLLIAEVRQKGPARPTADL
jgi:hypothetical protein